MTRSNSMTRRGAVALLTLALVCALAAAGPAAGRNRGEEGSTALTVHRIGTPRYVRASDGRIHVDYDLLLTNSFVGDLTLKRLQIRSGGRILQDLDAAALAAHAHPLLRESQPLSVIPPSSSAMVLIDIPLRRHAKAPRQLNHRISYSLPADTPANALIDSTVVQGPSLKVPRQPALKIASPLRGSGWWAGGGCCDPGQRHRGMILARNGTLLTPEMFDIDWLQIANGGIFSGDGKALSDYPGYGAKVYAATAGKVVKMVNDKPEAPLTGPSRELDGTDDFAGNQVVIRIDRDRYAFYAHFQPGTVRVRVGQRVRTGQVLGLLGNSGNSSAPHLHFGIHDGPLPATSNSLPFQIDRYRYEGSAEFNEADGTVPLTGTPHDERDTYPLNLSSQLYR
jgi:hypothetical protein